MSQVETGQTQRVCQASWEQQGSGERVLPSALAFQPSANTVMTFVCELLPPSEWLFSVLLLWSCVQLCYLRCGLLAGPHELWAPVHSSSPESLAAK